MAKSLVLNNYTYLRLMIHKRCVFISYEVNLQFYWEWVRSLKGASLEAQPARKNQKKWGWNSETMLWHREQRVISYSVGIIDGR